LIAKRLGADEIAPRYVLRFHSGGL
jgi:hypothetical protein